MLSLVPQPDPDIQGDQPEKLNICWVNESSPLVVNGVSDTAHFTVPPLVEAGHDVTFIHPGPESESIGGAEMIHTKSVRDIRSGFQVGIHSAKKFRRLFEERDFDAVVVNSPMRTPKSVRLFIGGNAIDAATKLGIPTTVIAGTNNKRFAEDMGMGLFTPLLDKQERRMHGKADLNLSPSDATDEYVLDLDVPSERIVRWTRGIASMFSADRRGTPAVNELRRSWGLEDGDIAIVSAGRLAPEKSFHKLAVLRKLNDIPDFPRVKLAFAGDGPERQDLESLFGEDAIFMGMLNKEELANFYAAGDIFAFASQTDTYGQVVPQALRSGLVAIVANRGGPPSLIKDGAGFTYEPAESKYGEDTELFELVKKLVQDRELRESVSAAAVASVEGLSWELKASELVKYCRQAIDLKQTSLAAKGVTRLAFA